MKKFCFTVDDNIIFLKDLTCGNYKSIFAHPYLGLYKKLHEKYDLKIQLNLFYESDGFDLSQMSDRYRDEWAANADWLKLSFHSKRELPRPYEHSGYGEVFEDCEKVHRQILRFASDRSLAKTTTLHYCLATEDGVRALGEFGVRGLLGLYGSADAPRSSYCSNERESEQIRGGQTVVRDGIAYAGIDIVLNSFTKSEIISRLNEISGRELIKVMIHEQYFYPGDRHYQPDFEEKLDAAFASLTSAGYESTFFEDTFMERSNALILKAKKFCELTTAELYEIIRARNEIFLLEQGIICQDLDRLDYDALHCFIEQDGAVVAYLRAFSKKDEPYTVKIGRVLSVTHGIGLGTRIMTESIPKIKEAFNCKKISVNAQKHAQGFYERLGYKVVSGEFLEEGVVHVKMELDNL